MSHRGIPDDLVTQIPVPDVSKIGFLPPYPTNVNSNDIPQLYESGVDPRTPNPYTLYLPWYVIPRYPTTFAFCHIGSLGKTQQVSEGNFWENYNLEESLKITGVNLKLNRITDLVTHYTFNTMNIYVMKGSPFINVVTAVPFNITTIAGANLLGTNSIQEDTAISYGNIYKYDSNFPRTFYYNGRSPSGEQLTFTPGATSTMDVVINGVSYHREGVSGELFADNTTAGVYYKVSIIIETQLVTTVITRFNERRIWSFYGATVSGSGTAFTITPNSSGLVQIALGNDPNYQFGTGVYPVQGTCDISSSDSFTYNFFPLSGDTSKSLLMYSLPHMSKGFSVTNWSSVGSLPINTLTYGPMTLGKITSASVTFTPAAGVSVPSDPWILDVDPTDELKAQVNADLATINVGDAGLGTYANGQWMYKYARVIWLGFKLGISVITHATILYNYIVDFLNRALPPSVPSRDPYYLIYDPKFGGFPDKANLSSVGDNYGFWFYNDHHFHFGYWLYTMAVLKLVNPSFVVIPQMTAILLDVCNPDSVIYNDTVKVRCKDFYVGHSWATGLRGGSEKQQESSGEALLCYLGSYLFSLGLSETEATGLLISRTLFVNAAKHAYEMELSAALQYYNNETPWLNYDIPTTGMITYMGRKVTLDWLMRPNSYPGRMLGIVGIQTIPFNQTSLRRVKTEWVDRQRNYPTYNYRVDYNLVASLINGTYFDTYPTHLPEYPPYDQAEGGYWGIQGLLFLSRGSDTTGLRALYDTARTRNLLLKQWESYSNVLYWLMRKDQKVIPPPPPLNGDNGGNGSTDEDSIFWLFAIIGFLIVIAVIVIIAASRPRRRYYY